MLVLDTDVLTIIQRAAGEEYESLADYLDRASVEIYVTIVSVEEQMRGWLSAIARVKSVSAEVAPYLKLRELLEDFQTRPILDFDDRAASKWVEMRAAKIRVATMDLKIAAIAIANNGVLVTKNLRDFKKIPGLELSDWTF